MALGTVSDVTSTHDTYSRQYVVGIVIAMGIMHMSALLHLILAQPQLVLQSGIPIPCALADILAQAIEDGDYVHRFTPASQVYPTLIDCM